MTGRLLLIMMLFVLNYDKEANAQLGDTLTLTLQDAIDLALKQSFDARDLTLTLESAEHNVSAARGAFRTNADISLVAPDFREQVQAINAPNQPTTFNTTGTLDWRAQLSIQQPLPTNGRMGLETFLRQRRDSIFLESLNTTQKNKRFFTNVRFTFSQPLLVPNILKLGLERANLQLERAQRTFTRTEVDIIYQVTQAFFNLYRAEQQLAIAREAQSQQQASFDLARQKFEAGLIPEVEALQQEVDFAQSSSELLSAQGTYSRQSDQFKLVLAMPLDTSISLQSDMTVNQISIDDSKALEHGLRHRAEIRENEIDQRLAEIRIKEIDAQRKFRIDLSGFYELTGVSNSGLPFDTGTGELFRSSLSDLEQRPKNRGIFLNVSVPLWDSGVNRSRVNAQRAIAQQNALSVQESRLQVERDVRNVLTRIKEAGSRLDVLKQSEEVARRSYDISLARFDNGDITSQNLALDRQRLTQARQAFLDAYIQYQLALADLKRQTLYDFENDRSLVE